MTYIEHILFLGGFLISDNHSPLNNTSNYFITYFREQCLKMSCLIQHNLWVILQ